MKPLSERDENFLHSPVFRGDLFSVGMKPLSERDENNLFKKLTKTYNISCRNEATL